MKIEKEIKDPIAIISDLKVKKIGNGAMILVPQKYRGLKAMVVIYE